MHKINRIAFKNFKFFHNEETVVKLDEKNLLLYGENGSGKSSIYWGLYTLFQSVYKEKENVDVYFDAQGIKSLTNSHMKEGEDSFVKLFLTNNGEDERDSIICFDTVNTKDEPRLVKQFSKYSSFINFKSLFNHHNSLHSKEIDLFPLFEYDILNSTNFGIEAESLEGNDFYNSNDVWKEIKEKRIEIVLFSDEETGEALETSEEIEFDKLIGYFNEKFESYLEKLNKFVTTILEEDFFFPFKLNIIYDGVTRIILPTSVSIAKPPMIKLRIYDGDKLIQKPQSYLNEAKLTAIALAIKFAIVLEKYEDKGDVELPKLLVLDDVMISMDMGNREIVSDILLERFKDYQMIFFTHDLNFYKYISHRINQKGRKDKWKFLEMYSEEKDEQNPEHPIIIDSLLSPIEKAKFYNKRKDFTTCSLYLRQTLENKLKERIPEELYKRTDDKFTNLNNLWAILKARYENIDANFFDKKMVERFESSRLLVLNPKAHHQQIETPAYQYEINKIFDFINYLDGLDKPSKTILLSKGMNIEFNHPEIDYSIEYTLSTDYYTDSINGEKVIYYPKLKTVHWQFEGDDFKHPVTGHVYTEETVLGFKEHGLKTKIQELCDCAPLNMDEVKFVENTTIKGTPWKFSEIYIKKED